MVLYTLQRLKHLLYYDFKICSLFFQSRNQLQVYSVSLTVVVKKYFEHFFCNCLWHKYDEYTKNSNIFSRNRPIAAEGTFI